MSVDPYDCDPSGEGCENCPWFCDDCEGDTEKRYQEYRKSLTEKQVEEIIREDWIEKPV